MKKPLISVVLPTHNGRRFVDESIESVIKQTCQDWELIIVDDASTDTTPVRIDWWSTQDERITVLHLPKNRTLPGALNDGFARAKGDFHTWTSDDNWYHPDALARMLDVLQREPDVAIVYADRINVDEYGMVIKRHDSGSADDLSMMNSIGACFLYRSAVTTTLNGYDENLFGAEDYDFWLRAALRFRFRRLPEPLYFYRLQGESLTEKKYHLIAKNVEKTTRRWLPQVNWPSETAKTHAYIEWGVRCLRAGTWEEVYEPWLRQTPWLAEESRCWMRREVLKTATRLVWEAAFRRDWADFAKFRGYLSEVRDDPEVAQLLATRFYPRWAYHLKDRLSAARRYLAAQCRRVFRQPRLERDVSGSGNPKLRRRLGQTCDTRRLTQDTSLSARRVHHPRLLQHRPRQGQRLRDPNGNRAACTSVQTALVLSYFFPPSAAVGVFRTIRHVRYLPDFGWKPLVVTPMPEALDDPRFDSALCAGIPENTVVARTRVLRPVSSLRAYLKHSLAIWSRRTIDLKVTEHPGSHDTYRSLSMLSAVGRLCDILLGTPDAEMGWTLPALYAALRLTRQYHPAVIYSTGPPHSTHLIAMLLKALTGLPMVIDLRDPWARSKWYRNSNKCQERMQGWLEQLCVRVADRIILNTPQLREDFCDAYAKSLHGKFIAMPNGYDPAALPHVESLTKQSGRTVGNGQIVLCHPGTVYGRRTLRYLLGALQQLTRAGVSVSFEQIGAIDDSFDLPMYLREQGLSSCVRLAGQLSHDATLQRMAAADVLVVLQPGTANQVPGKLYEMLPFRKPILALTEQGATADIIERFRLGAVVNPVDTGAIASAIINVAYGRSNCSESDWNEALKAFDGRRLVGELAQVLNGVV
jgi:glycosyltransferase involved in cell wall biosynthesis